VNKPFKYKAFLSYSHADAKHARHIHRFLETYSIPRHLVAETQEQVVIPRNLRPIFKDREELPSAADLSDKVNAALEASEFLIVVCSPDSAASHWVNEEILTFKRLGRAEQILCIIVAGEPNASDIHGREGEECFCPALRHRLGADGQVTNDRAEPIAADARPGGDGEQLANLKLVAGMLGVGLDELRRRDLQRRHRRLAVITAASISGMVLTMMLAWAAVVARDDAERRREQADDLIGYMLGELRGRLEEVGRLDVMDSVAGKAMDYFDDLPSRDLTDSVLANRAEALLQLGQVQLTRGNHDEALRAFSASLLASQELSARDPTNLDRLFDLGQAHFWVGYVHWENNELDAADASLRRYYEKSLELYKADPANSDYILELGYAFNNLAILSNRRGDIKAAIDYNQQMIDLSRTALEQEPGNETYRLALADAYSWSGSILRNDRQFQASAKTFESYLRLAEEASSTDPSDTQWIDHRMYAHRFAGEAALDLGQSGAAASHFEEGLALANELLDIEPENELWQIERAVLAERLARMAIRSGNVVQGLENLEALQTEVRAQIAGGADRTDWDVIDLRIELIKAEVALANGNPELASTIAEPLVVSAQELLSANPSSKMRMALRARSLTLAARLAETEQRSQAADQTWRVALGTIAALDPDHSGPDLLDAYVCASLYAGRPQDVEQETNALLRAGYRHPDFVAVLDAHGVEYAPLEP